MKEREALKLALEALEEIAWSNSTDWQRDRAKVVIPAIKEVLAQPEQEPVGEVSKAEFGDYPVICWRKGYVAKIGDKFYTTPPQRTWVGLRDSQKLAIIRDCSHLSMTQLIELVEEEIRRNNNA